jgi:hypothetical protein
LQGRRGRPRLDARALKILITRVEGDEDAHAHMIEGRATFRGTELGFTGVAFGRIGGFNVRVQLDERSRAALEQMGLDATGIEELEVHMQRMIVEGRFYSSPEVAQHQHRFP